jgi:hypothetical protein
MNRQQRTLLFLYSSGNIAGSALGILGLMLYFVVSVLLGGSGLLLLIVPALYAIGWLAVQMLGSPAAELRLRQQLTVGEIRDQLETLVRSIRKRVPKEILVKVESIKDSILQILPNIVDITSADRDIYTIRQTALDYLPETLENYLKLPPAFRNLHPVRDGKTAKVLLLEQLEILDREMREIVQDFYRNDSQRLMAHGRFLESRFQKTDLWFDESA